MGLFSLALSMPTRNCPSVPKHPVYVYIRRKREKVIFFSELLYPQLSDVIIATAEEFYSDYFWCNRNANRGFRNNPLFRTFTTVDMRWFQRLVRPAAERWPRFHACDARIDVPQHMSVFLSLSLLPFPSTSPPRPWDRLVSPILESHLVPEIYKKNIYPWNSTDVPETIYSLTSLFLFSRSCSDTFFTLIEFSFRLCFLSY